MIEIEGYRLSKKDEMNWAVEKKAIVKDGKRKGEIDWRICGYFPKFKQAALHILNRVVLIEDVENLTDAIRAIEAAEEKIVSAIQALEK